MKTIVVMTYYQLMHSIALALTFEEKPFLFFCMEFLNPDESLLTRIEKTNVFSGVKGITKRGEFQNLLVDLRKTKGMVEDEIDQIGNSLFEKHLEPLYAEELSEADKNDEFYIYNDFQWHYYYIAKHFDNIIGVEDGYCSLKQEIAIHRHKGDKELLYPFIERGYFPQPLFKEKNIKRIISSKSFEGLDNYYNSKIEVWDFKDIIAQNKEEYKRALKEIFGLDKFDIEGKSSLYIGQPLDRSRYCSALINYLMCKKIMRKEIEEGYKVFYKPHPADRNNPDMYGGDGVVVLQKDFPVEVLNYQGVSFDRIVTFGSTSVNLTTCSKEVVKYFDKTSFERSEVTDYIREEVKNETITIDTYIRVTELTPETYVNVYSCIFRHSNIRTRVHIVADDRLDIKECELYFDKNNASEMIKAYKKGKVNTKERALWHRELKWISKWINRYRPQFHYHKIASLDEWEIFTKLISCSEEYDYTMIVDAINPMFNITKDIISALKVRIYPAVIYKKHTKVINEQNTEIRRDLSPGYLDNEYRGDIINTLLHREVIRELYNSGGTYVELSSLLNSYDDLVSKRDISLEISAEHYKHIENGNSYYKKIIDELCEQNHGLEKSGLVANIVYECYDWSSVKNASAETSTIDKITESLIDDEVLRNIVYKLFAKGLFIDRELSAETELNQEIDFYQAAKPVIDRAAKAGMLERFDNIERVKNRIVYNRKKS